jgi:hypothetical protein
MEREKEQISAKKTPISSTEEEKKETAVTRAPETEEKTIEQRAAENVAKALAVENAKLKAELSAFDREFFEELEDLKLACSEQQEAAASPTRSKAKMSSSLSTPLSPRTIGRLGKSARMSLKGSRSDKLCCPHTPSLTSATGLRIHSLSRGSMT